MIAILPRGGIPLQAFLKRVEFELIHQALDRGRGNKAQAARLLRINRTTLIWKLKTHGIRLRAPCGKKSIQ